MIPRTNSSDNHEDLIEKWTAEQLALRSKLIFKDDNLSFSTHRAPTDLEEDANLVDYDIPDVHATDLQDLGIDGLQFVGGLDISFVDEALSDTVKVREQVRSPGDSRPNHPDAYATIVVIEYPSLKLLHSITQPLYITVPYRPTFLSYREAPAYMSLLDALRSELSAEQRDHEFPQVILVDGNGRLHIREAGVASVIGVRANIPTIGVAKTFLPHHPEGLPSDMRAKASNHWRSGQQSMRQMCRQVLHENGSWFGLYSFDGNHYAGAALIPATSKSPIFVSAGHRVSLSTAIRITLALGKYRIPEPIRLADKISRAAASGDNKIQY